MATKTLRPNAAGDETNIQNQYPASTYHWDKVDEVTADDASTYVRCDHGNAVRDLYNIPTYSSGPINKITVYIRCRLYGGGANGAIAYTAIKTGGTAYNGSGNNLTTTWTLYSTEYTTNPQSGVAWTWSDIDSLQIGVQLFGTYVPTPAVDLGDCTQVYVVVDYVSYTDIGIRLKPAGSTLKIGTQTLAGHALRIRKGATTYGIPLIATNDGSACGFRIYDGSAVKSIPKVT